MDKPIPKPRIAAFEITRRCPLNCRHCRAAADWQTQDVLSTQECIRILKALADFHRCVVILTGGEPMAREDFYQILEAGRSAGLPMALATCGWYLDQPAAERLKKAGLMSLSFSLDGADEQTHDAFRQSPGAFQMTLRGIQFARQAELPFQINTTITKFNIAQIDRIAQKAAELDATCWNPFILVPVGRGDAIGNLLLDRGEYEDLLIRLTLIKRRLAIQLRLTCGPQFARVARQEKIERADRIPGCLAATEFVFISYQGDVQTCGFLEISAGNLVKNGFDFGAIWTHSNFLNTLRDHVRYKEACGRCGFLDICRGCRARAMAVYGDYLQQDPICMLAKPLGKKDL